ncbi:MAG TPA: sigma-70 family RNA polymerase sigma factor [Polyangia bacterium]|nr:sigma-70 family RNA polymerase sigma factor [Polyangia bacterium]
MSGTAAAVGEAREQFLALVADVRPELHRYCARLVGSVIEGEDLVQEALAKAFYALPLQPETPPLRPWLFRIAHNAAVDHLRSHGHKLADLHPDIEGVRREADGLDEGRDPAAVRAALARFLALPLGQRSAVILKDVLGHSLEETAETMGTTVLAVKAALVRGRRSLAHAERDERPVEPEARAVLDRYAGLFNARDWDGLRALIGDDCRLDLVSRSERRGKQVGLYFARYEKEPVTMRVGRLEGRLAIGVFAAGAAAPAYFILLEVAGGRVAFIRDFRYVPYIAAEAVFEPA